MKKFIYIIPLLCGLNCFGQTETKEDFVNQIIQAVYDNNNRVYLLDTARGSKFDFIDSMTFLQEANSILGVSILSDIIINSANSKSEKWVTSNLHGVKCVNETSKSYVNLMKKSVDTRREILFIANPVFSSDHRFVMIRMGRICGKTCGDSCVYFFKKVNGKWERIFKTGCVII